MLTGLNPYTTGGPLTALKPTTVNYFFLERGHVMEYFRLGSGEKRVVGLFFGPREFVLPSHTGFSCFQELDRVQTDRLPYRAVIRALRNYEGADERYREIQRRYWRKVAERMIVLNSMTAEKRFAHLKATQPWVLELAAEEDVANYLEVSVGMLRELKRGVSSLY